MKTLVINLKKSTDRRENITRLLAGYRSLDVEFVEGVDGREMTDDERQREFDTKQGNFRYMGKVRPGEIGCTLSHQKCYRKISEEQLPCALILEDDLTEGADFDALTVLLAPLLDNPEPRVILLSGNFWWLTSRPINDTFRLARVFDGYLTHAYLINLAAARLLVEQRPGYLADDWRYLIRKGLRLYGLLPHAVGQDHAAFTSTIDHKKRQPLDTRRQRIWCRIRREPFKHLRKQLLGKVGHHEPE